MINTPKFIIIFAIFFAILMLAALIAIFALSSSIGDEARMGLWIVAVTFGFIALSFVFGAWLFRRVMGGANADLLRGIAGAGGDAVPAGLSATALVLSVRDTGITINHINAMMEVGLRVQLDGQAPYDTQTRVTLGRHSWGAIQPGMTVAIRVDPKDRQRVAIDLQGSAGAGASMAGQQAGAPGTVQAPGGNFQIPGVSGAFDGSKVVSTADILATGERGEAEIRSVSHTGATAAQMAPGRQLPPDEADDPMVMIAMQVRPRYGEPFDSQAIMRVPDGKLALLAIGKRVPVAWPEGQPDSVTIDWPALR